MNNKKVSHWMRIIHRYLGFFLVGIMSVYAISGMLLIFRNTDFLKDEQTTIKKVAPGLPEEEIGKAIGIKELKVSRKDADTFFFRDGYYVSSTGQSVFKSKKLPVALDLMTKLHKSKSGDPLYYLNLFFGFSLLFFSISSVFMFVPKSIIFKQGLYIALAGAILTVVLILMR